MSALKGRSGGINQRNQIDFTKFTEFANVAQRFHISYSSFIILDIDLIITVIIRHKVRRVRGYIV